LGNANAFPLMAMGAASGQILEQVNINQGEADHLRREAERKKGKGGERRGRKKGSRDTSSVYGKWRFINKRETASGKKPGLPEKMQRFSKKKGLLDSVAEVCSRREDPQGLAGVGRKRRKGL